MSYVKDLLKIREVLECEVNNLLVVFSAKEKVLPLHIQYQNENTEMSYAVEESVDREPHLVLLYDRDSTVWYDIEPDCIELEELAEIADKLFYLKNLMPRNKYEKNINKKN